MPMDGMQPEAKIDEILRHFEEAEKDSGASTKLPFKNVQGYVTKFVSSEEKLTMRGIRRWMHKATLQDDTGEIGLVLWGDDNTLLNNKDFIVIPSAEVKRFHNYTKNGIIPQIQVQNAWETKWRIGYNMQGFGIMWSSSEGVEKIRRCEEFLKKEKKLLWGVNWTMEENRLRRIKWPIKGYIYYKGDIIAIATITNFTPHSETIFHSNAERITTSEIDLRSWATNFGLKPDYKNYLHIEKLDICEKSFPHTDIDMFDSGKSMPGWIQKFVYVKELNREPDNTNDDGETEMLKRIMRAAGEIAE